MAPVSRRTFLTTAAATGAAPLAVTAGGSADAAPRQPDDPAPADATIRGRVLDAGTGRPIPAASVHSAGTDVYTTTDRGGSFTLTGVPGTSQLVVAGTEGYGFGNAAPDAGAVTITLTRQDARTAPRNEYPRPDLDRRPATGGAWLPLDGTWSFDFDPDDIGRQQRWYASAHRFTKAIAVPFSYCSLAAWGEESLASPVLFASAFGRYRGPVWYRRSFTVPDSFAGRDTLLRIGAATWGAAVWLDGRPVLDEAGTGYGEISASLGRLAPGSSHVLAVRVVAPATDATSPYPMGKQDGWFTDSAGIWQPVWLEPVDAARLDSVHVTPRVTFRRPLDPEVDTATVTVSVSAAGTDTGTVTIALHDPHGRRVGHRTVELSGGAATAELPITDPTLWTPERPDLYTARIRLDAGTHGRDGVDTTFGLRTFTRDWAPGHAPADTDDPHEQYQYFYLNNRPIFLRGVLDQAYNPWGIYTYTGVTAGPSFDGGTVREPEPGSMLFDLAAAIDQGFTLVRTHVKVNEPAYYHWADRLGLLVWQDLPNCPYRAYQQQAHDNWTATMVQAIDGLHNHPCVIGWNLFNEGWGLGGGLGPGSHPRPADQPFVAAMVARARALDPTRLIDDNSPTLAQPHGDTDVNDFHYYSGSRTTWTRLLDQQSADVYPGSSWNFLAGHRQAGQPWLNAEFGNNFNLTIGLFRSYRKLAGYVYTQNTDCEYEPTTSYSYTRLPKEGGFVDHRGAVRGMDLFNTSDVVCLTPGDTPAGGARVRVRVHVSHFGERDLDGARLHWQVGGTDPIGVRLATSNAGSRAISPARYTVTDAGTIEVDLPARLRAGYLWVWLAAGGRTVAENHLTLTGPAGPAAAEATSFDPTEPAAASWTGGTIGSDGQQTGLGHGYVEYRVPVPDRVGQWTSLVVEASTCSVESGLLQSATHTSMQNPLASTTTSRHRSFPSAVTVSVDGTEVGRTVLADDPFDARGIVGAGDLRYARYGHRIAVPIEAKRLRGRSSVTVRFASSGGGLTLFGPESGRYGIAPQLVPGRVGPLPGEGNRDRPPRLPRFAVRPSIYLAAPGRVSGDRVAVLSVVNDTTEPMSAPRARLVVPDGVTATPVGPALPAKLEPGAAHHGRWRLDFGSLPAGRRIPVTALGSATLGAGRGSRTVTGRVDVGVTATGSFDLADYPRVGIDDRFGADGSADYDVFAPHPVQEPKPTVTFRGRLAATGSGSFYGIVAARVRPRSGRAVSIVDIGGFIVPKSTQDAFFVGFAQGPDDYLMGWTGYGNKTIGIDACVAGTVRSVRGSMPAPAAVGDRWAMAFDGTDVSLWLDRGHGFEVAFGAATTDLGSLGAVTDYRYAVGLRGTAGTLSATRFVGRSG